AGVDRLDQRRPFVAAALGGGRPRGLAVLVGGVDLAVEPGQLQQLAPELRLERGYAHRVMASAKSTRPRAGERNWRNRMKFTDDCSAPSCRACRLRTQHRAQ